MNGIVEYLRGMVERDPDRVIYDFLDVEKEPFGEKRFTNKELYEKMNEFACELKRKGAKKDDRAVILCMQDEGTVFAVLGCILAGVVFTVVPPPLDDSKLNRFVSVLKSCHPKFLISNKEKEQSSGKNVTGHLLKNAFFDTVRLRRIYTDELRPWDGKDYYFEHQPDDLLYLQYTSGSTSRPKGVMVTYGNLTSCLEQVEAIVDWNSDDNNLASWVPFYHNIGLIAAIFIPMLADHGVSYFISTLQFLARPTAWLKVLSDFKVNITVAPNSAYDALANILTQKQADEFDLRHMKMLINGSEFVDPNTVKKFCDLFHLKEDAFSAGYGLSECVCVATLSACEYITKTIDPDLYREGRFVPVEGPGKTFVSVGRAAGDMVIRTVHEDGTLCEKDQIGEICLKSSSLASGYFRDPEETKKFHFHIPGEEGDFYRTGDMGIMYENYLYLTGRIKEMIIISGKNIFPGDITLALHDNGLDSFIRSAAVFSVRTPGGEKPVLAAEVLPSTDRDFAVRQINRIVSRDFGFSFSDIVFCPLNSLPRTDNGKIRTLMTKQLYEEGKLEKTYSSSGRTGAVTAPSQEEIEVDIDETSDDNAIRGAIRKVFEKLLSNSSFKDEDSFLELGGDSLRMMELVGSLEEKLKHRIDIRQIATDPTVRGISEYLRRVLDGKEDAETVDLYKEAVLPEDIQVYREYKGLPSEAKNIFLTGSTGFLGAYLIRSLVKQIPDVKVYCHARAVSDDKALERIISNMKRFNCWEEELRSHIIPVTGNLNSEKLGMRSDVYEELSNTIDLVIHNGAILNFIYPYAKMKDTNVTATAECLRFACYGKPKYFNYISSYSVYDNPSHFGKKVSEDDPLASSEGYFLGYSQTKWVAEKLVEQASYRGLKTIVHRPGDITGTLEDGIWKLEDLISRTLVGCIQLGAAPNIPDVKVHLTPVDYVADAITGICRQDDTYGGAFNILNPDVMNAEGIYQTMLKAGYDVKLESYENWCKALTACTPDQNVLRILSCLFTDDRDDEESLRVRYGRNQALISTEKTDALMAKLGIHCPPLDEKLLASYLRYFASCGYIPKPKI